MAALHIHPYRHNPFHAPAPSSHGNWAGAPRSDVSAARRSRCCASRRTDTRALRLIWPLQLPRIDRSALVMRAMARSRAVWRSHCLLSGPGWTTLRPVGARVIARGTLDFSEAVVSVAGCVSRKGRYRASCREVVVGKGLGGVGVGGSSGDSGDVDRADLQSLIWKAGRRHRGGPLYSRGAPFAVCRRAM